MRLRNAIITLTQSILRSLQGANDTANPPTITCSIEDICAFGGFKGQDPDQSFRYLSSMFRDWSRSLITFFDSDSSLRFSCMLVSFISSSTCLHKLRLLGRCVSTPIARHIFPCRLILLGQIEREMGSAGFIITYMAAGIFGYVNPFYISTLERADGGTRRNVLGGNFARPGVPSLGASGAIFGMFAVSASVYLKIPCFVH